MTVLLEKELEKLVGKRPERKGIIYVAGAYRADTEYKVQENIRHAEKAEVKLIKEGWCVFCPHKNFSLLGGVVDDEVFLGMGMVFLKLSSAVYVLNNWASSEGAQRELRQARRDGLQIIFEEE